jgi:hypothetical protein
MNDLFIVSPLPNGKTDINNRGEPSDYIGASWTYPDAGHGDRARIWQDHIDYTAGLLYFLANDERVPAALREEIAGWGLCSDEFLYTRNWPHQLYVREARRMVGDFVMSQRDIQTDLTKYDAIGMGSYNSDSHNVQRFAQPDGTVQNEGNMEVPVKPYQIPYCAASAETASGNLLVPVCISSSHVAYSTLRMEPVYMILGHAARLPQKWRSTRAFRAGDRHAGVIRKLRPGRGDGILEEVADDQKTRTRLDCRCRAACAAAGPSPHSLFAASGAT